MADGIVDDVAILHVGDLLVGIFATWAAVAAAQIGPGHERFARRGLQPQSRLKGEACVRSFQVWRALVDEKYGNASRAGGQAAAAQTRRWHFANGGNEPQAIRPVERCHKRFACLGSGEFNLGLRGLWVPSVSPWPAHRFLHGARDALRLSGGAIRSLAALRALVVVVAPFDGRDERVDLLGSKHAQAD